MIQASINDEHILCMIIHEETILSWTGLILVSMFTVSTCQSIYTYKHTYLLSINVFVTNLYVCIQVCTHIDICVYVPICLLPNCYYYFILFHSIFFLSFLSSSHFVKTTMVYSWLSNVFISVTVLCAISNILVCSFVHW